MNFLHCGKFKVQLGLQTRIMGILNVTPDSFSDGGKYYDRHEAVAHAIRMEEEGADFIDIGGESSRPGASPVSTEEELRRILPVLEALIPRINIPVSIDTCKPEVARKAIQAGASMINDIQGLKNPKMAEVAAEYRLPAVLMHMQNRPETMQLNPAEPETRQTSRRSASTSPRSKWSTSTGRSRRRRSDSAASIASACRTPSSGPRPVAAAPFWSRETRRTSQRTTRA